MFKLGLEVISTMVTYVILETDQISDFWFLLFDDVDWLLRLSHFLCSLIDFTKE